LKTITKLVLLLALPTMEVYAQAPPPLPTGNNGIAARYPGDVNIRADANVIYADNFESYSTPSQLTANWNNLFQTQYTRIATEPGNFFAGTRALEFRIPVSSSEISNSVWKAISPSQDIVFVRAYTKFDAGFDASGSGHNGISMSAQYCCPGVPANGTNKFLVDVENSRESTSETAPGPTNAYVYYPDQRDLYGDHWFPDGTIIPFSSTPGNFGPSFISRPNFTPQRNRWYSYELMVKANTPGSRDGRVALWIDGNLAADWQNVRLRDTTALKIERITLDLHIKHNPNRVNLKWYDNVVVAKSYIGPMSSGSTSTILPPTNLRAVVQ
jgi:hypothetical protein